MDHRGIAPDPPQVTAQVIDSALALIRAELRLFASYVRTSVSRAGLSLAFGWVAVTLAQLALVLIVLSPMLLGVRPWPAVALAIALALGLSALAAGAAIWALRSVKKALEPSQSPSRTSVSFEPEPRS